MSSHVRNPLSVALLLAASACASTRTPSAEDPAPFTRLRVDSTVYNSLLRQLDSVRADTALLNTFARIQADTALWSRHQRLLDDPDVIARAQRLTAELDSILARMRTPAGANRRP